MFQIVRREQFSDQTFLWEIDAPDVARAARPGHFVMLRLDENGERIPLTVADFDRQRGTVTVVVQTLGKTTREMRDNFAQGDNFVDFVGPLGLAQHIDKVGHVVLVGGGLFVRSGSGWLFAGREDALVKIKGRWVNLVELEERLGADISGLRECASVCIPDADGVDAVAFFYVARDGAQAAVEQLLRQRAGQLPHYQRPNWLAPTTTLPRTSTGKLLRRRLTERLQRTD